MAKGYRITGWHILIVGIAILLLLAWQLGVFSQLGIVEEKEVVDVSVNKPIQFGLMDPLGGAAIGTATIKVYDGTQLLETLTTDGTSGLITSSQPYRSGKSLNVQVSKSGYVTRWFVVTVPKMSPADAQSLTTNYVVLTTYNLGTFEIRVVRDDTGAAQTSASSKINMTLFATTPLKLTITIANTEDNSGYISSYDPVSKVNLNAVLLTSSTTSYMTVQNAGQYVARGTVSNWIQAVNDDLVTKHLSGGVYVKPGQQAFTITLYKGSLPLRTVANQTITFDVYKYFDAAYFAQQGIGGPDASTAASQFSLEFYGPDS